MKAERARPGMRTRRSAVPFEQKRRRSRRTPNAGEAPELQAFSPAKDGGEIFLGSRSAAEVRVYRNPRYQPIKAQLQTCSGGQEMLEQSQLDWPQLAFNVPWSRQLTTCTLGG
jgi:hypothetical protein